MKSIGNPQAGVSVVISIISNVPPYGKGYDLNIQNGYAHGFPTNQHSISFTYRADNTFYDLIVSDFTPNYDQAYDVKAIRQDGIWSLYADNSLIGTAPDPAGLTEFHHVHMPLAGSVVIDNVVIQTKPDSIEVLVDIKPRSAPNKINPRNKGRIPVAILTNEVFDASIVDPDTILFGVTGIEAAPAHYNWEDVDGDGDIDMILHFKTQETGIKCTDTALLLSGSTIDGIAIYGFDSVDTVGCKK